ncbi:MAG: twin-arginine translocation signal domain-containing protein, partial [Anaerolineae bacterium]
MLSGVRRDATPTSAPHHALRLREFRSNTVELGRRTFLKLTGASVAAGALYRVGLTRLPHPSAPDEQPFGP